MAVAAVPTLRTLLLFIRLQHEEVQERSLFAVQPKCHLMHCWAAALAVIGVLCEFRLDLSNLNSILCGTEGLRSLSNFAVAHCCAKLYS